MADNPRNNISNEERRKQEKERKAKDRERRKISRANALFFDGIHPRLVEEGLEGKFVLIDGEHVWGIAGDKRKLSKCFQEVHIEGQLGISCPLTYQVNAEEARQYLTKEQERIKRARRAKKDSARKKQEKSVSKSKSKSRAEPKSEPKPKKSRSKQRTRYRGGPEKNSREESREYEPAGRQRQATEAQEAYRPDQEQGSTYHAKPEKRKVYKGVSPISSNKNNQKKAKKPEEDKMAKQKQKKSEKENGKGKDSQSSAPHNPRPPQKTPQYILNDFKGLYQDYFNARNIQQGVKERGSQVFDEPRVYDAVVKNAQKFLAGTKYASAASRLQGVSEGGNDTLPKDHLMGFSQAWYSGSRNLLAGFFSTSGNLEAILAQAPEDKMKKTIPQYSPPKNAQGHEELAGMHGAYLMSDALLSLYQNAESRKDKVESALAIRQEAEAAVTNDVANEKDENLKAYLAAFARIVGRNSAIAESVMEVVVKERRDAFEGKLGSYKDVKGYFTRMTEDMKAGMAESDMLFDALYQVSP